MSVQGLCGNLNLLHIRTVFKEAVYSSDKFSSTNDRLDDKNEIISAIESIIVKQTGLKQNIISGIKYMLGETVDNISEHSKSECGYIIAQCYPTSKCIDICIGDTGITLLGSYAGVLLG